MQNLVLALIWQTPTQGEVSVKSVSMVDLQRRLHRYIQVVAADRKKKTARSYSPAPSIPLSCAKFTLADNN
jgi:hypothetical protein